MKNNFIDIGGVPYSRLANYQGWKVWIVGFNINTERHLIIKDLSGNESKIELDNDQLRLREKFKRQHK